MDFFMRWLMILSVESNKLVTFKKFLILGTKVRQNSISNISTYVS